MGMWDNYRHMVKVQLQGATAGTTKYGWLESMSELLMYGIVVALCFAHRWYIPAILLMLVVIAMVVVVTKK